VITLIGRMSPGDLWSALTGPGNLGPLLTSVESGGVTLGVLIVIGTPLAWMLARGRLPFPRVWEAGILCALLLPPLVIGLLLVFMVGPYTWIGSILGWLHASATNTFLALVIAEVYESAPYYVLGAQAAFASVDTSLEQQAGLLGDRPSRVLRRITLPLAAPGIVTALIFTFISAWNEFLVALTLSLGEPTSQQPLTVAINQYIGEYSVDWGHLFAAGLVATVPVIILFAFIERRVVGGLTAGAVK